jgi:hypothetical protein
LRDRRGSDRRNRGLQVQHCRAGALAFQFSFSRGFSVTDRQSIPHSYRERFRLDGLCEHVTDDRSNIWSGRRIRAYLAAADAEQSIAQRKSAAHADPGAVQHRRSALQRERSVLEFRYDVVPHGIAARAAARRRISPGIQQWERNYAERSALPDQRL